MAETAEPQPVKLIVGMLSGRRELLGEAAERLARDLGPIDLSGEVVDFDFTHYYEAEMGGGLLRQFVAFERLIDPGRLADVKHTTNAIESQFAAAASGGPARPVNLDPGYVTEGKLVLASTKDFAHRVYVGGGIYAEVTLQYVHGKWVAHELTFPDYASGRYDAFLSEARRLLRQLLGRKERQG